MPYPHDWLSEGVEQPQASQWLSELEGINPRNFGAKGDLVFVSDASLVAGSAAVSSASGLFQASDVGKTFVCSGAGAAVAPTGSTTSGSAQITSVSSLAGIVPGMLITGAGIPAGSTVSAIIGASTIVVSQNATATASGVALTVSGSLSGTVVSFQSATQVTVSVNAATSVSAATFGWGTDDSLAFRRAVDRFNASGGSLVVPAGNYFVSGGYTLSAAGVIRGDGKGSAGYATTITLLPGANTDLFTVAGKMVTVRDIGLDGQYLSQTASSRALVLNAGAAFGVVENLWVTSFNGDGIVLSGAGTTGWHFRNIEMRSNQGHGILINASAFDSDFYSINIGTSGLSGVKCVAADNTFTQLHSWGNGTLNTTSDKEGVCLPSGVGGCRFVNCYFETNWENGVRMPNSGCKQHQFVGCTFWKNYGQGVYAFSAQHISFSGCVFLNNGQNGSSGSNATGITADTAAFWSVVGNVFYDDQTTKTQTYAYYEVGTANNNTVIGNDMAAANHKTGSSVIVGAANVPVSASMGSYNQV